MLLIKPIKLLSILTILLAFSLTTQAAPIYYGILPVNIKVSYKANNNPYKLQFYVVNNSQNQQNLSNFKFIPIAPPPINPIKVGNITNDCNSILKNQGDACNIYVNVRADGNTNTDISRKPINFRFSMKIQSKNAGSIISAPLPTIFQFATGKPIANANRVITFKNLCPAASKLFVGISGGAVNSIKPAIPGKLTTCNSDADCYPGSKCINTNPKQCFSVNPIPNNTDNPGNPFFLKYNGTSRIIIPTFDNGIDTVWSGGIAGRLNCNNNKCPIADCGGVSADTVRGCSPGKGFSQPVTTAEFTFNSENAITTATFNGTRYIRSDNTDTDTYDISMINGITFAPLSMQPLAVTWKSANPYNCGIPGFKKTRDPLGGCSWNFKPTSNSYNWVAFKKGANQCGSCKAPEVCGMSYNPNATPGSKITKHCGIRLGYWTADAVCTADPQMNTPEFPCTDPVQSSLTYADLFGCSSGNLAQSCYNVDNNTCCGCVNWNTVSDVHVPYPPTQVCKGMNPIWQTNSQPRLEFLKRGCPTAYTYPYDDASSTFTCQKLNKDNINTTNYLITFCPQNV